MGAYRINFQRFNSSFTNANLTTSTSRGSPLDDLICPLRNRASRHLRSQRWNVEWVVRDARAWCGVLCGVRTRVTPRRLPRRTNPFSFSLFPARTLYTPWEGSEPNTRYTIRHTPYTIHHDQSHRVPQDPIPQYLSTSVISTPIISGRRRCRCRDGAFLIPHRSSLIPHSYLIAHTSFLIAHSSFLIPRTSYLVPATPSLLRVLALTSTMRYGTVRVAH